MRFRAVLVDDEPLALARLERLLERHHEVVEVVGTADNGTDAVALIHDVRPDVVFLDVQMPGLTGFDVLERLDYMPWVIFSTAYDKYALRAFDVHSVDYLLKPVEEARLELAVDKLHRVAEGGPGDLSDRIRLALEALDSRHRNRIHVRIGDRIKLIPVADVAFFRAKDKYVEVHTRAGAHSIAEPLSKLESELPPDDFVRVHRSVIVNINFIDEITRTFSGSYAIRIQGPKGVLLPVSRRYKSRLDL